MPEQRCSPGSGRFVPVPRPPPPWDVAAPAPPPAGGRLSDDDDVRLEAAREAARRWGQVAVLKGARTVIAGPAGELVRSDIVTPALATAGSGDVLAGAIGAFLAAGLAPFAAAGCGGAVHGAAGLLAEDRI